MATKIVTVEMACPGCGALIVAVLNARNAHIKCLTEFDVEPNND